MPTMLARRPTPLRLNLPRNAPAFFQPGCGILDTMNRPRVFTHIVRVQMALVAIFVSTVFLDDPTWFKCLLWGLAVYAFVNLIRCES